MFEGIFLQKKLAPARLSAFGFEMIDGIYRYTCPIMEDEFLLSITFDRHGNPATFLTECDTGEEYVLYKTNAEGSYVGRVRAAIADVLREVAMTCFDDSTFRQTQTLHLLRHAADVYGSEPEFLWKDTPQNGILRRKDSGKWYAAILTVRQSKLGLLSDAPVEIVNLHASPEVVSGLLTRPEVYPAWHMNKKSWFTVILDGHMADEELFAWVAESYVLAGKNSK